jgi:Mor family transcriptional regulator
LSFTDDAQFVLFGKRTQPNRMQGYPTARGVFQDKFPNLLSEQPLNPELNQHPTPNQMLNSEFESKKLVSELKQMIDGKMFVLSKKIDFYAKELENARKDEYKGKEPNKIIMQFKGQIDEIINTLKVIESPGTDRALGEVILQYKDSQRDMNYPKERELATQIITRLEDMVSVYLHLTSSLSDLNKYLIGLYNETIIKAQAKEDAIKSQPRIEVKQRLGGRPPLRKPRAKDEEEELGEEDELEGE